MEDMTRFIINMIYFVLGVAATYFGLYYRFSHTELTETELLLAIWPLSIVSIFLAISYIVIKYLFKWK